MEDGFLVRITTVLVDPTKVRMDHFAIACASQDLAAELLRAERPLTADQVMIFTGLFPGDIMVAIGMEADEVRSLGSACAG